MRSGAKAILKPPLGANFYYRKQGSGPNPLDWARGFLRRIEKVNPRNLDCIGFGEVTLPIRRDLEVV